jgi:hypothetical protein
MSQPVTTDSPTEFARRMIPLLKEYTEKLDHLLRRGQRLCVSPKDGSEKGVRDRDRERRHAEWQFLQQAANRLARPMRDLARHVSQMVEHGSLDDATRLELQLRLAEFEHALQSAPQLLQDYNPLK